MYIYIYNIFIFYVKFYVYSKCIFIIICMYNYMYYKKTRIYFIFFIYLIHLFTFILLYSKKTINSIHITYICTYY